MSLNIKSSQARELAAELVRLTRVRSPLLLFVSGLTGAAASKETALRTVC